MCNCIHTFTHIPTHAHTRTLTHTHTHTRTHTQEMLGYYTMAQTSFLLFMSVIVAMAVCMAWRVADEELAERLVSGRDAAHVFTAVHTHTFSLTHIYVYTYIHINTHRHTRSLSLSNTYTHICTHRQRRSGWKGKTPSHSSSEMKSWNYTEIQHPQYDRRCLTLILLLSKCVMYHDFLTACYNYLIL